MLHARLRRPFGGAETTAWIRDAPNSACCGDRGYRTPKDKGAQISALMSGTGKTAGTSHRKVPERWGGPQLGRFLWHRS
jgi:hypothetical protein